jgi:FtsH-binding integral membrane protein
LQIAAAIPLFVILFGKNTPLCLSLRRMRPEGRLLRRIFLLGLPGAIQTSISSFANVFTQSYIAGADGIQAANLGGYSAYSKTYTFMVQPLSALSAGVTIFAAQNVGAGNATRVRRAFGYICLISSVLAVLFSTLATLFYEPLLALYGVSSVEDIKARLSEVYSEATAAWVVGTVLTSVKEQSQVLTYARYYDDKKMEGVNFVPVLMVRENHDQMAFGKASYTDYVLKSSSRKEAVFTVDITVTDGKETRVFSDVRITMVKEKNGWRLDTTTYASLK